MIPLSGGIMAPMKTRNKKERSMGDRQLTPDRIMQLGLGFWGSKTLLSAIELGLFNELAKGPLDAGAVTELLRLHRRSARDFLAALLALRRRSGTGDRHADTP